MLFFIHVFDQNIHKRNEQKEYQEAVREVLIDISDKEEILCKG